MWKNLVALWLGWSLIGTGAAGAQLQGGDLVVSCAAPGNGLYRVSRTGTVETLLVASVNFPNAVQMWSDNVDLAVALADPVSSFVQNSFVRVTPDGLVTTIAPVQPGPPNALDLAENGSFLVFTATQNAVLSVTGAGAITTVQVVGSGALNAGTIDLADGGLLVGVFWQLPQGGLFKVTPAGAIVTHAWGLGRVSAIGFDPLQGDTVVTRFDAPEVLRIGASGGVTTLAVFTGANAVAIDQDRTLWLAGGAVMIHASPAGAPIATFTLPGNATGVEIYGRRTLAGSGTATAGSTYSLRIQSHLPGDGNQPYVLVASTALGPALALPDGRPVAVGMSDLLLLSLAGQVPGASGFRGTLDPFGRATAALQIPPGLAGLRVHLAGVVLDQHLGRVSTVLRSIGLTLR